jgi:hypothetical protein
VDVDDEDDEDVNDEDHEPGFMPYICQDPVNGYLVMIIAHLEEYR